MQVEPHRSKRSLVTALAAVVVLSCSAAAMAQSAAGEKPPGDRRGGPPAEALTACKSLKAGDACSFSADRGAASGSCQAPEGRPLACRPKDAPAPGGDTPPSSRK